jgi:hypothetical protein
MIRLTSWCRQVSRRHATGAGGSESYASTMKGYLRYRGGHERFVER